MPSTVKSFADIGFIDPYAAGKGDLGEWFKDIVLGNIAAHQEALAEYNATSKANREALNDPFGTGVGLSPTGLGSSLGGTFTSGLGAAGGITGAPPAPKYYNWLVSEVIKRSGIEIPKGAKASDIAGDAWKMLSRDEKEQVVYDIGVKSMKDENAGSFLGNLLIKPTMPLSLIGPFNAIPGAAAGSAVATVGITGAGGVGTIVGNPALGELGTGILTGAGAAGGGGGGGGGGEVQYPEAPEGKPDEGGMEEGPKPKWWEKLGYESKDEAVKDGYVKVGGVWRKEAVKPDDEDPRPDREIPPIGGIPGVEPGQIPDEGSENEPPTGLPPGTNPEPTVETPTPDNPFDGMAQNLSIFHGGYGRTPYQNVAPPQQEGVLGIRHSLPVQSAMSEAGVQTPSLAAATAPQGLGLTDATTPGTGASAPLTTAAGRIRARRKGLGFGG